MLTLQVTNSDRSETKMVSFSQDIIKIGKMPSNHLCIEDDSHVARMHACIEVTGPDEVWVLDLGAPSGVVVNGTKVFSRRVQKGDEIVLGGTRLLVVDHETRT